MNVLYYVTCLKDRVCCQNCFQVSQMRSEESRVPAFVFCNSGCSPSSVTDIWYADISTNDLYKFPTVLFSRGEKLLVICLWKPRKPLKVSFKKISKSWWFGLVYNPRVLVHIHGAGVAVDHARDVTAVGNKYYHWIPLTVQVKSSLSMPY